MESQRHTLGRNSERILSELSPRKYYLVYDFICLRILFMSIWFPILVRNIIVPNYGRISIRKVMNL